MLSYEKVPAPGCAVQEPWAIGDPAVCEQLDRVMSIKVDIVKAMTDLTESG